MLEVGFAELKLNYKRLASDLGDNPFDTLGVLALVESAQSKQTHLVTLGILMEFKGLLMHRFSKFIKDQVGRGWIVFRGTTVLEQHFLLNVTEYVRST